jgi:hypothetical protein
MRVRTPVRVMTGVRGHAPGFTGPVLPCTHKEYA